MTTFAAILPGAFPLVALVCVGVIFYIHRESFFEEEKRDKEQQSKRPADTN